MSNISQKEQDELVIGTAFGYKTEHIRRFVESLRRHYKGPVCLITKEKDKHFGDYLAKKDIFAYEVSAEIPVSLIQVQRYTFYKKIIESFYSSAKRIFITDVRDVFFQTSPFALPFEKELCFYCEPILIKNCLANGPWMKKFAPNTFEEICDRYAICSGTTLGTGQGMLDYCTQMSDEILKLKAVGPEDQGIHMRLIFGNRFSSFDCFNNEEHAVTTCTYQRTLTLNRDLKTLNKDGTITPVLHQWDRMGRLIEAIALSTTTYPI